MYSLTISDIIERFTAAETVVMGDVVYGACCVDDYTATALECDFLIHYGHSCLVPITTTLIKALYVFVDIKFDCDHLVSTLKANFKPGNKIVLASTVQFVASLDIVRQNLADVFSIAIPQAKPLSSGEILGCTAPKLDSAGDHDALVFIGDGRFHLEAMMIANRNIPAYLYNAYSNEITRETYDHDRMMHMREGAIRKARSAKKIGLILGTLGRQGSTKVLAYLRSLLSSSRLSYCTVLLSEISPQKLRAFNNIDSWIQIACPRLSIDWGEQFSAPVLTPYEAAVAFQATTWKPDYPMDFYSKDSHGPWTPLHDAKT